MNLQELITQGENKQLEFKEQLPKNESIVKTVISFSNTSGGKLIVGVSDEREIVGIDEANIFELQDKISSLIFDSCYPNILPEIYTVNMEGKLLLVIEVFRGNLLPYYLKKEGKNKGTYLRVGATNRQASFEMIVEFFRPNTTDYDQTMPNSAELMPNATELNSEEEQIINFLNQNQKITSLDVAELLSLKERRSRDILKILERKGYIQKIGKTKGSFYILREK